MDALLPLMTAAALPPIEADPPRAGHQRVRDRCFDIFGDVTWKVSPQIELGVGLRWTHDDKTTSISDSVLNGRSILGGFLGALQTPGLSDRDHHALSRLRRPSGDPAGPLLPLFADLPADRQ